MLMNEKRDRDTPDAPPAKAKRRKVRTARRAPNSLDLSPTTHYAFVAGVEGDDTTGYHLELQCVESTWMERLWRFFLSTSEGQRFLQLWDARDFDAAYPKLSRDDLLFSYETWCWFVLQVRDDGGDLKGAPVSVLRCFAEADSPFWREHGGKLRESDWFFVSLQPDEPASDTCCPGELCTLGWTAGQDVLDDVFLVALERIPDSTRGKQIPQAGLKALHFPQVHPDLLAKPDRAPEIGAGPGVARLDVTYEEASPVDTPDGSVQKSLSAWLEREVLSPVGRAVAGLVGKARDWLDSLVPGLPGPLAVAGACPGHGGAAWGERDWLRGPFAYIGSGVPGGAQAPNPMAEPAPAAAMPPLLQPFVGVLDIGQGNCSALYDSQGVPFAYFDFGLASGGTAWTMPPAPPAPCLCNHPLIILSHWDLDHYDLARNNHVAYQLRWLAPQQHMGTPDVRESIARLVTYGGQLSLYVSAAPSHIRFDWGWVEKCTGPWAVRNNSGLAAFVCVKDNGAVPAAAAGVAHPAPLVPVLPGAAAAAIAAVMPVGPGAFIAPALVTAALAWAGLQWGAITVARTAVNQVRANAAALGVASNPVTEAVVATVALGGTGVPVPALAVLGQAVVVAVTALGVAALPGAVLLNVIGQIPGFGVPLGGGPAFGPLLAAALAGLAPGLPPANLNNAVGATGGVHAYVLQAARAHQPPGPAPVIPAVMTGHAPFDPAERYVLLTGDANFNVVPSLGHNGVGGLPAAPPCVVGLMATHHGSNMVNGAAIHADTIPWAPGTQATRAASKASAAATGALGLGAAMNVVAVCAAAAAADELAAMPALPAAPPGAVPAAYLGGGLAGQAAAALAAAPAAANVGAMPGANVDVDWAALAVSAAQNIPGNDLANAWLGVTAVIFPPAGLGVPPAFFGANLPNIERVVPVVLAEALAAGFSRTQAVRTAAAAMAVISALPGQDAVNVARVARFAAASMIGGAGGAGAIHVAVLAGPAAAAAAIPVAMGTMLGQVVAQAVWWVWNGAGIGGLAVGGGGPVFAPGNNLLARTAAMAVGRNLGHAVPALVNLPPAFANLPPQLAILLRATEAAVAQQGQPRHFAGAANASDRIAYSYGIGPGPGFAHPHVNVAGVGHPDPKAADKYAGHGWGGRMNTSVNAWQSAQPYPAPALLAAPAAPLAGGHLALGWEDFSGMGGYEGPLRGTAAAGGGVAAANALPRPCPTCAGLNFVC
ncbi:hypothetical protein [Myxococcus sp. RHSTA-1-4]|uniref:hypothetical protein n=1 Tax=Myxococcus sp. RHSTA-1-4 TaxID=2874601 RepID=UPI001CC16844|nr:hypothetical protein [Myxococcus sp. RHSTA-1-4]MBZ4415810.1 hypothetical protein [Myxococcus sp. RHSTA-1-4]